MKKTLLTASALVVAALLSSPASAQSHTKGALCPTAASECDRKTNTLWLCAPVPNQNKKPGDATIYAWKTNGVCTNNLNPGEDIDKNAEKEKKAGEERSKRNQQVIDDEKKADEKRKADEKKKADAKKAADDKKVADDKKAAADKKAAEDKKAKDNKK